MRRKIVLTVLLILFGGLGFFVLRRGASTPADARTDGAVSQRADATATRGSPDAGDATTDSTQRMARGSTDAGAMSDVQAQTLDRQLRVASTGWELVAPGVVANGGGSTTDSSLYASGLSVSYHKVDGARGIREALALGGKKDDGADIGVVPLPTFVAAYEKFRALRPEVFFVTGWSDGREGLATQTKEDLNDPDDPDSVTLRGEPGTPSTYAALSILDISGIRPASVTIEPSFDDDTPDFAAVARDVESLSKVPPELELRVTTAEATRLVPFVAIASEGFLKRHPEAVRQWIAGWLEGRETLKRDVPGAARTIAAASESVETVEMVDLLGWVDYIGLRENTRVTGLSGRGAATLERLFQLSWRMWRESGVLSTPSPASLPVSTKTLMTLVNERGIDRTETRSPSPAGSADNEIFLTYRHKRELDRNKFVKDLGLVAGVFARSHCTVSVRRNPELAQELIDDTITRFGLDKDRLTADDGVRWPGRAGIDVHRP